MTTLPCQTESDTVVWHWPVPLDTYDRTPTCSSSEAAALAQLDQWLHQHQCRNLDLLLRPLHRLTQPLTDALTYMQIEPSRQQTVINALLQQMAVRRVTYWGWTLADWSAVLTAALPLSYRYPAFAAAYLLRCFPNLPGFPINSPSFARRVFGEERVTAVLERLLTPLRDWGYRGRAQEYRSGVCSILLFIGSPRVEDLTHDALVRIQHEAVLPRYQWVVGVVSRVLTSLGLLEQPLPPQPTLDPEWLQVIRFEGVPEAWAALCQRWYDTSTFEPRTRRSMRCDLLRVGRWLAEHHPMITHPQEWTRELAAEFVAAVNRMQVGAWTHPQQHVHNRGQPAKPHSKSGILYAIRTFFRDCQEWGWIPTRFNPARCFQTPRAIRLARGPQPRVIADDSWAKLLHAGLNLTAADLPHNLPNLDKSHYPIEMVRAIALVWLFAGLRSDEIRRLRLGCVRWYQDDVVVAGTQEILTKESVCMLDVPVNKTSSAFTKPVDRYAGLAIAAWEAVRPQQPHLIDRKTGEAVQFLFSYRGHQIGDGYINGSLIPMLCQKAGVPLQDARGTITSHRARSTIASQLYNAKEPMSLSELQAWLGHKHPNSTQHYTKISPTKLAKSYVDAGYFGRNVRTIEVLIDQEAVMNGDAAKGLPWKYYDLGHGYCTYDFFEQCEHRMACAHCAFYRPKDAFLELLLEKQAHLLHMQQDIPLTELELATVDGDLAATAQLIGQLTDVPTPAGQTPRQLRGERRGEGGEGGAGEGVGA